MASTARGAPTHRGFHTDDEGKHPFDENAGRVAGQKVGQAKHELGWQQVYGDRGYHSGLAAAHEQIDAIAAGKAIAEYALRTYGVPTLTAAQKRLYDAEAARDKRSRRAPCLLDEITGATPDSRVAAARAEVERERRAPIVAANLRELAEIEARMAALAQRIERETLAAALERLRPPRLERVLERRLAFRR